MVRAMCRSGGFKLVRVGTGETVVVYVRVRWAMRKRVNMCFIEGVQGLGRAWELMLVMNMVSIVEEEGRFGNSKY